MLIVYGAHCQSNGGEMMGGSVTVASEKGVGSTFTVRLPRIPPELVTGDRPAFSPEAREAVRPAVLRS